MKSILKKGIAILEVMAMSLVLLAGVDFGTISAKADDEIYFMAEEEEQACYVGESVTFNVVSSDEDINWDDYTVTWQKVDFLWDDETGADEERTDLEGSGPSCTIEETVESDFHYYRPSGYVYYLATIYDSQDEVIDEVMFNLYNRETYHRKPGNSFFVNEGESLTLTAEVYDFDYNLIDISGEEYSFKWYKLVDEENVELDETGSEYTIDKIEKADFNLDEPTYHVDIYKNGELWISAPYYINDKDTYVDAWGGEYYVAEGDSVTLIPEICDYEGNPIESSDSKYSFKWYREEYNYETEETITDELDVTDSSYTIDKVQKSDFFDQESCYVEYKVVVYVNGEEGATATFWIYRDEDSEPITDAETTTGNTPIMVEPTTVAPTTTAVSQPTDKPTSAANVTAPGKAKITKINTKKKSAKKIKLTLKKINKAKGYQVAVYTSKKNAKNDKKAIFKKIVKKASVTVSSKKFKNKKNLYVTARAYVLNGKTKVYGKWSTAKKVKIKK